jgi:hypothetical protein
MVLSLVYWGELDRLRRDLKAMAFAITARRINAAIKVWDDIESASFHLRQAIEATWWSLFCSYGAEVGRAQIASGLDGESAASILSEDVEKFLRGWFAPDENRIQAGMRAVGSPDLYVPPPDFVDENATIIKKQRFVSRFWASSVEVPFGVKLAQHVDVLADAYEYLCGWTHVTPLLVCGFFGGAEQVPELSVPSIIRVIATATWQLQRYLLFDKRWNNGSYVAVVGPHLDEAAARILSLGVPFLEQLRHARKPVEVEFPDGSKLCPFPK